MRLWIANKIHLSNAALHEAVSVVDDVVGIKDDVVGWLKEEGESTFLENS